MKPWFYMWMMGLFIGWALAGFFLLAPLSAKGAFWAAGAIALAAVNTLLSLFAVGVMLDRLVKAVIQEIHRKG